MIFEKQDIVLGFILVGIVEACLMSNFAPKMPLRQQLGSCQEVLRSYCRRFCFALLFGIASVNFPILNSPRLHLAVARGAQDKKEIWYFHLVAQCTSFPFCMLHSIMWCIERALVGNEFVHPEIILPRLEEHSKKGKLKLEFSCTKHQFCLFFCCALSSGRFQLGRNVLQSIKTKTLSVILGVATCMFAQVLSSKRLM